MVLLDLLSFKFRGLWKPILNKILNFKQILNIQYINDDSSKVITKGENYEDKRYGNDV